MPTFVYKCNDCGSKYEVFHKVREEKENVICPECSSASSSKMVTAANFSGFSAKAAELPAMPSCATGNCSTGMCGLN